MSNQKAPITVIVPAKNEEKNLADCLRSVDWVEKVFVVDSHSDDATPEICEEFGAELVQFDYDGGWPKKKNWAIKNLPIKTEWIRHSRCRQMDLPRTPQRNGSGDPESGIQRLLRSLEIHVPEPLDETLLEPRQDAAPIPEGQG